MRKRTTNILTGILAGGLLTTLVIRLKNIPGGMFLSGLALGLIWITIIVMTCLVLTVLFKRRFKAQSFWTILFLTTTIGFTYLHYKLYSPTLKIVVPANYTGKVVLVLSNVSENILTIDTNGIGYIDQLTFDRTYTRPIVVDRNGKNLDSLLRGFNQSSFWGVGKSCCVEGEEFYTQSFIIESNGTEKLFINRSVAGLINRKLIKTFKPEHSLIQSETNTTAIENETKR